MLPEYCERRAEREANQKEEQERAEREKEAGFTPPPELLDEWTGAVHT